MHDVCVALGFPIVGVVLGELMTPFEDSPDSAVASAPSLSCPVTIICLTSSSQEGGALPLPSQVSRQGSPPGLQLRWLWLSYS